MSILAPLSTSLTATGCRLSVGELAGTTTSTLSRTNVKRISTSTCSVAPPRTVNGADSASANPSRDRADDVAAGGNVRERHLPDGIARRLADDDVAVDVAQLDSNRRNAQPLDDDGDDDATRARGRRLGPGLLLEKRQTRPGCRNRERRSGCGPAAGGAGHGEAKYENGDRTRHG